MLKRESNLIGNDRYEGFCVDMLEKIAEILRFKYTIQPTPGQVYGIKDPKTGEWNGMVKELINNVSRN